MLQENIFWTEFNTGFISESFNNIVFYQATDVQTGDRDLWRTDGTPEGTYLLLELEGGLMKPGGFTELNGAVYFSGIIFNEDGEKRRALFKTDGTEEGTVMVDVLPTCTNHANNNIEQMIKVDDVLYWTYLGGECILRSDGTAEGTWFYYNPEDLLDILDLVPAGNRFYFAATDMMFQSSFYRADGTPLGVDVFPNSISPRGDYASLGDKLIYTAKNPDNVNSNDLWVANDDDLSTFLLHDINTIEEGGRIGNLTPFNNMVYFTASQYLEDPMGNVTGTGTELWATNGILGGTIQVKDIYPGPNSSQISNIIVVDDKMYFLARYSDQEYALFQSDGTAEGTFPYLNLPYEALIAARPKDLYYHNNNFYLTMGDTFTGRELWRINHNLINSTTESNKALVSPKVIPNPFHETSIIQFDQTIPKGAQILFFDQFGQQVSLNYSIEGDHITLHRNNLPSGMYYYQVQIEGKSVGQGKFIIH